MNIFTKEKQAKTRRAENIPERHFLVVCPEKNRLASLLECIYTGHLSARNSGLIPSALVHPDNAGLASASGVFETVHTIREGESLRQALQKIAPHILYVPGADLRAQIDAFFSGARIRIGGTRLRLVDSLLRLHRREDLRTLKHRGLDLMPAKSALRFNQTLEKLPGLPAEPFVWLSLFEDHEIAGNWPAGHAARLSRLLQSMGFKTVIPLPPELSAPAMDLRRSESEKRQKLRNEIEYLRRNCPSIIPVNIESAQDKARGMTAASAIVSPAGPDSLLASMLGKPVIILHDMQSQAPPEEITGFNGKIASPISMFLKTAETIEKHIMPSVDRCNSHCPSCAHDSCVETISPERVYDGLKKLLLPF